MHQSTGAPTTYIFSEVPNDDPLPQDTLFEATLQHHSQRKALLRISL